MINIKLLSQELFAINIDDWAQAKRLQRITQLEERGRSRGQLTLAIILAIIAEKLCCFTSYFFRTSHTFPCGLAPVSEIAAAV